MGRASSTSSCPAESIPGDAVSYREDGSRDGLDWLQAVPKAQDSGFEKIRMGFDAQADLAIMELNDTFGNKTVLRFSAMQRNPQFPEQLFRFTPPKGADVLSD